MAAYVRGALQHFQVHKSQALVLKARRPKLPLIAKMPKRDATPLNSWGATNADGQTWPTDYSAFITPAGTVEEGEGGQSHRQIATRLGFPPGGNGGNWNIVQNYDTGSTPIETAAGYRRRLRLIPYKSLRSRAEEPARPIPDTFVPHHVKTEACYLGKHGIVAPPRTAPCPQPESIDASSDLAQRQGRRPLSQQFH